MSDINEQMVEQIAESRGYDRGFTAGTNHAHGLINNYIDWLKQQRSVLEEENTSEPGINDIQVLQLQINSLEQAKFIIRRGYWQGDK